MDKQSKFKLLQRIALTRDEADEYFENYAEEKKKKCEIFLPFSIVYETGEKFLNVLPYLDLSQKDKIWGISFHGMLIHRKNKKAHTIRTLKSKLQQENKRCDRYSRFRHFPTMRDWEELFAGFDAFNEVMQNLRSCGVEADNLLMNKDYLTKKDLFIKFVNNAVSVSFAQDKAEVFSRFIVYL